MIKIGDRMPEFEVMDQDGNKVIGINNEISWLFMCRYL